jgi:2-polyprenyl-3-methyl-5-hydroxy-6-metoxy-1,4-benzoquinol methylase
METDDQLKNLKEGVTELFIQKKVPLFQNKVYANEYEARQSSFGRVRLVQSSHTGFVFNDAFDENLMDYDENYHNEQTNSPYYKRHQNSIFELLDTFGLEGKKIVEIGCGKGDFFNILKDHQLDCTGFDPAYEGDDPGIVKDYFSEKYNLQADVIIVRHTLEHIANPHSFLHQIASANNYKGHIFIEVPTFDWILEKNAFWDIFYEHSNYFTRQTLSLMFDNPANGDLFGGQYIYAYAALDTLREKIARQKFTPLTAFSFEQKVNEWKKFINENEGIIVWGAGAKGSTFVNLIDPDKVKIEAVIDINPEKQQKYVAVTGHPIYGPAKLKQLNSKHIIVMNENYLEEITRQVKEMGLNTNITSV